MNLIEGAEAAKAWRPHHRHPPEHLDVSTTEGKWKGTVGVAEHLGSDTFIHIHGGAGCDPMTVRAGGEVGCASWRHVYLTPQEHNLHRFDAQGLRIA
jgi:multiple sugar transport system ATP-binding protein